MPPIIRDSAIDSYKDFSIKNTKGSRNNKRNQRTSKSSFDVFDPFVFFMLRSLISDRIQPQESKPRPMIKNHASPGFFGGAGGALGGAGGAFGGAGGALGGTGPPGGGGAPAPAADTPGGGGILGSSAPQLLHTSASGRFTVSHWGHLFSFFCAVGGLKHMVIAP
jgi:hypothetical protein